MATGKSYLRPFSRPLHSMPHLPTTVQKTRKKKRKKADLPSEDMARRPTAETSSVTTISDTPMRKTIPEKVTADLTFHMLFSMWDMTLARMVVG